MIKPEPVPEIVSTGADTADDVNLLETSIPVSSLFSVGPRRLLCGGSLVGERLEARCWV